MHEESSDRKIIYVNTKRVGYLIGHHGRTIILFQQQSGAKINIMTPNSRAKETPVEISGSSENVGRALRMILDLFSLDNYSSRFWQQMQDVKQGQVDQCNGGDKPIIGHEEARVPSYFAEFLRVSESIQKIENESGSRVIVMPESDLDTSYSIINVIGTAQGNTKAFDILNERYREVEEANRRVPKSCFDQGNQHESKSENCLEDENIYDRPLIKNSEINSEIHIKMENTSITSSPSLLRKHMKIPCKICKFIPLQLISRKNQVEIKLKELSPKSSESQQNIYEQTVIISGSENNVERAKDDLSKEIEECQNHLLRNNFNMSKQDIKESKSLTNEKYDNNDKESIDKQSTKNDKMASIEAQDSKIEENICDISLKYKTESNLTESNYDKSSQDIKKLNILNDKIEKYEDAKVLEHPFSNINHDQSFLDYEEKKDIALTTGIRAVKGFLSNEYGSKRQKIVD